MIVSEPRQLVEKHRNFGTPIVIFNEILLSKPDTRGEGSENPDF